MEAIAALGLACNVMQLVSFSREVISMAEKVYKGGSVDEAVHDRATQLSTLSTSVQNSLANALQNGHSASQKDLLDAARKCHDASTDLRGEIDKISGSAAAKGRVFNAISTAVKAKVRQGRLEKIEKTMRDWQRLVDSGLLVQICSATEAQSIQNRADFDKLDHTVRDLVSEIAKGNALLEAKVASESTAIQSHVSTDGSKTRDTLVRHIDEQAKITLESVGKGLGRLRLEASSEKLLKSLKFEGMHEREHLIVDSHNKTFHWIFLSKLPVLNDFSEWLSSTKKLYWISGKAGSGKSTLVKFIVKNEKTRQLLKPGTLLLSYYLWSPGNPMQKSVKGLLCTLLHQLLLQDATLAEILLESQPNIDSKDHVTDWAVQDLKSCLSLCFSSCMRLKCLFLDGLDEIISSDGPSDLLDLIDELSDIEDMKICVASRPEPVFKHHFQDRPSLRLQDLTEPDIRRFCQDKLRSFINLPEGFILPGEKYEKTNLVDILVDKAEGVFLWVHLTLKSIQRGCANRDSEQEILKRVQGLPNDLDGLYQAMWMRANVDRGIYEQRAAKYLNTLMESNEASKDFLQVAIHKSGTSVFEMMAACDYSVQQDFLTGTAHPAVEKLERSCGSIMNNIESHCGGLVEVKDDEDHLRMLKSYWIGASEWDNVKRFNGITITFIHRTALDFLKDTQQGRAILKIDNSSHEDRLVNLARSCLIRNLLWQRGESPDFRDFMDLMSFIETVSREASNCETQLLLRTLEKLYSKICKDVREEEPGRGLLDFLGIAANFGFTSFVLSSLADLEKSRKQNTNLHYKGYLLDLSVTKPWMTSFNASKLALVHALVKCGAHSDTRAFHPIAPWHRNSLWFNTTPATSSVLNGLRHLRGKTWEIPKDLDSTMEVCNAISLLIQRQDQLEPLVLVNMDATTSSSQDIEIQFAVKEGILSDPCVLCMEVNVRFTLELFLRTTARVAPTMVGNSAYTKLKNILDGGIVMEDQTRLSAKLFFFQDETVAIRALRPKLPTYLPADTLLELAVEAHVDSYNGDWISLEGRRDSIRNMIVEAAGETEGITSVDEFNATIYPHGWWGPTPSWYTLPYPPKHFEDIE